MSKKGNKKNANKSLEALKRKQYARGGRGGRAIPEKIPKLKPKPRDLFDDSVKEPKAPVAPPQGGGGKPYPTPKPKPTPMSNTDSFRIDQPLFRIDQFLRLSAICYRIPY